MDSPQKSKTTKVVKSKKPTQKKVVANKSKKLVVKKEVLEVLSVDAILDKINKNGIGSLTNNEKRFLDEESKKI